MPDRVPLPRQGVVVPLVTPLRRDGSFDEPSLRSLVDFVLEAGAVGVLVLGSSGESGALGSDVRLAVASAAAQAVAGRCHLVVGAPALGTRDAVEEGRRLAGAGAHSLLVSSPFMFPPSEVEMLSHFEAVAEAVDVPIVAYDVPSRVRVVLSPDLIAELAGSGLIAAVKDSSNDLAKQRVLVERTRWLDGFVRCTGAEEAIDGLLLGGFDVTVPGLANVFPTLHVSLAERAAAGDWAGAAERQGQIVELLSLYAAPLPGASPVAVFFATVKEALRQMGVIESSQTSQPFVQADEALCAHVHAVLDRAKAVVG
jgi:4-hydroxy-tetrahydrodipicolinate synthase